MLPVLLELGSSGFSNSGPRSAPTGRTRVSLTVKRRPEIVLTVVGSRPSGRPGGLIVAEGEDPVGRATLALPHTQRRAEVDLIGKYGRKHPTRTITLLQLCLEAVVQYTRRTTSGHLREATATTIRPGIPVKR